MSRFAGVLGADTLNGDAGRDTADFSDKASARVLNLNGATNALAMVGGVAEDTGRNIENILGGGGAHSLTGDALANALIGGAGNDALRGGLGADTLDGGANVDTVDYSDKSAAVRVTLNEATTVVVTVGGVAEDSLRNIEKLISGTGNDTLTGDALDNTLLGGTGADQLSGAASNDVLRGGSGKDVLDGGTGTDNTDHSDHAPALVVTLLGALVKTQFEGRLAEDTLRNVKNLIGGAVADSLTGDDATNLLRGGIGADILNGGTGYDVLDGSTGFDLADYSDRVMSVNVKLNANALSQVTLGGVAEDSVVKVKGVLGGSADDTLVGDALGNSLFGNAGADKLSGGAGSDAIRGGTGADVLKGGTATDNLDESDKTTTVQVTLNGANRVNVLVGGVVEDVVSEFEAVLGGSAADKPTGDLLANFLIGSGGADSLLGETGNDTLQGGTDNDSLTGDTVANTLTGRAGNDSLSDGSGNDTQSGGSGRGTLDGGTDSDTADFGDADLSVVVTLAGPSTVTASIGGLADDSLRNVENLILGTGNDGLGSDLLNNTLVGGAGNDSLNGGVGVDGLLGGGRAYSFVFDTAPNGLTNFDIIGDSNAADDAILLAGSVFAGLSGSVRPAARFVLSKSANAAVAQIIYDQATGSLFFDADGTGGGAKVLCDTLSGSPLLTSADFSII